MNSNSYNILLITAYFPPEINSSSQIYYDLSKNFVNAGHKVDVVTSYPRSHAVLNNEDIDVPLEETEGNLTIYRVKHPAQRDNKMLRGMEHFYIPLYYLKKLRKLIYNGKKYDACIIYIAPLPLCYLGKYISSVFHIPVILNIEEFHPQELTDVGFLTNKPIISIMKHIERFACKSADYITVHSPGGVPYLVERGANSDNMDVIFNSIDTKIIDETSILGNYKEIKKLSDKFVISYGGLLSPFQGLDKILDVAKTLLVDNPDILFQIAGDGMIKENLLKRINDEHISNVQIIPFMPRNEYINFIKSSDISIVALDNRMMSPVLPGKLAYLMGLGVPIVTIVNPDCETARVVREANAGIVVNPENISEFTEAILYIKNNPDVAERFGINGRKYMVENMSSAVTTEQYMKIIEKLNNINPS